jgi:thiamine phosphate synthase YjbQ (UPF0047 family)
VSNGVSLQVPVDKGNMALGTWQGIFEPPLTAEAQVSVEPK